VGGGGVAQPSFAELELCLCRNVREIRSGAICVKPGSRATTCAEDNNTKFLGVEIASRDRG
jgi:hypothetical protein